MTKPLIIIPACGFGTRMALAPNESKEMLLDPYNDNKPLIDWHLDLIKEFKTVIVTRFEKKDLSNHLSNNLEDKVIIYPMTQPKEWPDTVLLTKDLWSDNGNILILPDTRYKPTNIIEQMVKELETNDLVFAVHKVDDVRNWGKILLDPFSRKPLMTREKDDVKFELEGLAWGLIGFKKNVGEKLFQAYSNRTPFSLTFYKVSVINLESFKDICRSGKIEEY